MKKKVLKKIKPLFTKILTTMDQYTPDELRSAGGIITKTVTTIREYQTVLAVGDNVRNIKVGDIVQIDPIRYGRTWHKQGTLDESSNSIHDNPVKEFNFPIMEVNGKSCLLLEDRDVAFIIEEFGEVEVKDPPLIQVPKKHIIS